MNVYCFNKKGNYVQVCVSVYVHSFLKQQQQKSGVILEMILAMELCILNLKGMLWT